MERSGARWSTCALIIATTAALLAHSALTASAGAVSAVAPSTTRVSSTIAGAPGDGPSRQPWASADGRYVTFTSSAGNLVSGDTNFAQDVFLRDRAAGTTERISVSTEGGQ